MSIVQFIKSKVSTGYIIFVPCAALIIAAHVFGSGLWGDIIIDYGRELYIPWAISTGMSLYVDITNYFGPFSSYINAALFKVAGPSTQSLQNLNFIILALQCIAIHLVTSNIAGRYTSAACILFFTIYTGLNINEGLHNYNYIAPYSHELTHSIFLSFIFIYLLTNDKIQSQRRDAAAGLLLGCISMAKSEIFIAAVISFFANLAMNHLGSRQNNNTPHRAATILSCALIPPTIFFVYFTSISSAQAAFEYLSLMYTLPFNPPQPMRYFFSTISGSANITRSISTMLLSFLSVSALYYSYYKINVKKIPQTNRSKTAANVIFSLFIIITYAVALTLNHKLRIYATAFLPLALLISLSYILISTRKNKQTLDSTSVTLATLTIFSIVTMLKIILNTTANYYSSILAFPGFVSFITFVTWFITRQNPQKNNMGRWLSFPTAVLLTIILLPGLSLSIAKFYNPDKFLPIQSDTDVIRIDRDRGATINGIIDFLYRNKTDSDTLAVLPEGIGINYILRMRNPTPYINLAPPEWFTFGNTKITDAYVSNPPTWIVLLHRDTPEYNVGFFGKGYAQELYTWITDNYECIQCTKNIPFTKFNAYGACIYKTKPTN